MSRLPAFPGPDGTAKLGDKTGGGNVGKTVEVLGLGR